MKSHPDHVFVFLGNYLNYGGNSLEVAAFLLSALVLYGRRVVLLRGAMESEKACQHCGFAEEVFRKTNDPRFWREFMEPLSLLPLVALAHGHLLVSGGIAPKMNFNSIYGLYRRRMSPEQ
jgi:hypothetical protein